MMNDQPNPNAPQLHPRHPGIGCSTSLIQADGNTPEEGGIFFFFPSGATKSIAWRQTTQITPTLDAAKEFTTKVVASLQRDGLQSDIDRTNWASVVAAVQRVILDWNDELRSKVNLQWGKHFADEAKIHRAH
jgi:hypothetical protein